MLQSDLPKPVYSLISQLVILLSAHLPENNVQFRAAVNQRIRCFLDAP